MPYSDKDLLVATQIAYYHFDQDIIKANGYNATLKELFEQDPKVINTLRDNLASAEANGSSLEVSRAESAIELYNEIASGNSKYSNWVIRDIRDTNESTGFYGCLIETGPDSAIVGFRGSESYDSTQVRNDWVNADLGLLNEKLTKQQAEAQQFMKDICDKYDYSNYATSGHSLGGNLSEHATITAPEEMRDKITQCLNFDGPGFSDEYISHYANQISQVSDRITHYQWSLVGALLNQVPGENYQTIKVNDQVDGKYDFGSLTQKHDTSFVLFDENGNVIPGEMDNFAKSVGRLSKAIEDCPSWMGNALIWGISKVMTMSDTDKKVAAGMLIAGLAGFALTNPIGAVIGLVAVGALIVINYIFPDFFGETLVPFLMNALSSTIEICNAIVDGIVTVVKNAIEAAKDIIRLAADTVNRIVEGVATAIKGLIDWAKQIFNEGYKYSKSHPYIRVNTSRLRQYAERLAAINRKLRNLDERLDAFRGKVGLIDEGALRLADWTIGENGDLKGCIRYLNDTASDLENVEIRILGKMIRV